MTWCDEALGGAAEPFSAADYDKARQIARTMPMDDLRRAWRVVNHTRYAEQTSGTRFFASYFDALGQNEPGRACDFILAIVAAEPDDEQVALIGHGKLIGQLFLKHGALAQARLAPVAENSDRMRWLLGSAHWLIKSGLDPALSAVLLPLADRDAWGAWREASSITVDIASLSVGEFASLWIEANSRSPIERERDNLHSAIFNLCFDLAREDRMRAFELTRAVLDGTEVKPLLALLAAGLLEDLVVGGDETVLQAIEAEAAHNQRFKTVLCGVSLRRASPATASRIERACADAMPF